MRRMQSKVLLLLTVLMVMMFSCSAIFATDLDSIASGGASSSSYDNYYDNGSSPSSDDQTYNAITDYVSGYNYTTEEQMQKASIFASPLTNVIGTITGFIVMVTVALVGLVTALDLLYIAVPFTRSFLNPTQGGGAPAGGIPMGGMGMGRMGMGGMGMPQQGGAQPMEQGLRRRWVSDEALACVSMASQPAQPQGGMPMGGMGMGGMGGMGMQPQQPQQSQSTGSVITTYLKKRIIFLIVFAIALTLLLSSLFTDCGLNLAELLYKVVSKFNTSIANTSVY